MYLSDHRSGRIVYRLLLLAILFALAGCAGMQAYQEGNSLLDAGQEQQGLRKLEQAVQLEPRNAEYRITLANRRAGLINRHVARGETARREGRLDEAEAAYRQVLTLDAANAMARQGLHGLQQEIPLRRAVSEAAVLLKQGGASDMRVAAEKLRQVLVTDPGYKPALLLKQQVDELRRQDVRHDVRLSAAFRQAISLEFRDAPLKAVLEVIAKTSGLNFFYDKDIRPDIRATIFARNTTVEDALRLILTTNQLEQKVLNQDSLLIYPVTPQKTKEYQSLSVRSFYLTNADVKAVANTLKTIVKTKDLVVDERLGIIIMRDTPEAVRMAERIIALQDLGDPEVMLEVEILEIKRSRLLELGIAWPGSLTLSPVEGAKTTLQGLGNITSATTRAEIGNLTVNARKEDGDVNVLANPRIRVRNKERAKIQIGDRLPIFSTTTSTIGFASESVTYLDVGLKLEVEPTIHLDDDVAIRINLEVSTLGAQTISKAGSSAYQIGTRGANTVLRLKDGETQILAGLIQDGDRATARKIPLLGELPIAGRLFGSHKDENERNEILLSITPRVLRSIRRPDMLAIEFDSGTESKIGADALALSATVAGKATDIRVASAKPVMTAAGGESATAAASTDSVSFAWKNPSAVKVGEQFTAVLRIDSKQELRDVSARIAYDPRILRVVSVHEGSFFGQDHAATNFSQRVDPVQGRIFVSVERPDDAGDKGQATGAGDLVALTFAALKPTTLSKPALVAATLEPEARTPLALPLQFSLRVMP